MAHERLQRKEETHSHTYVHTDIRTLSRKEEGEEKEEAREKLIFQTDGTHLGERYGKGKDGRNIILARRKMTQETTDNDCEIRTGATEEKRKNISSSLLGSHELMKQAFVMKSTNEYTHVNVILLLLSCVSPNATTEQERELFRIDLRLRDVHL